MTYSWNTSEQKDICLLDFSRYKRTNGLFCRTRLLSLCERALPELAARLSWLHPIPLLFAYQRVNEEDCSYVQGLLPKGSKMLLCTCTQFISFSSATITEYEYFFFFFLAAHRLLFHSHIHQARQEISEQKSHISFFKIN